MNNKVNGREVYLLHHTYKYNGICQLVYTLHGLSDPARPGILVSSKLPKTDVNYLYGPWKCLFTSLHRGCMSTI